MTDAEARARLFRDVSRETRARVEAYHAALLRWQKAINLVSRSTLAEAWARHFLDSAQVFAHRPVQRGLWADLGSGGGFPGLVCAILGAEAAPDLRFALVESDRRKATFLQSVARDLGLSVAVHVARIEALAPLGADVISARALAPLPELLALAAPHLAPDGHALFQKGAGHAAELASARRDWQMEVETFPSSTAADAVVLRIGQLQHA